jgi:hypothetical protein
MLPLRAVYCGLSLGFVKCIGQFLDMHLQGLDLVLEMEFLLRQGVSFVIRDLSFLIECASSHLQR